jgi:putative transposase
MRKSKFNETQIVGILKKAEAGVPVADLLRKYGVSRRPPVLSSSRR